MRLLLLIILLHSTSLLGAPRVVTSILPLQEITAAIMAGTAEPQLIIDESASTHHFALRPSHMRLLQQAHLVIWIDRRFEAGFGRIAETLPRATRQLELLPQLALEETDGHIWFSTQRLQQVVQLIADNLIDIDPDNQSRYRDNAERLSLDIANWRSNSLPQLQSRQPRYITDHSFTDHFEADLGFAAIATIHDQHDDHGGLRELGELESLLQTQAVNCLLTLEPAPSALAQELALKYRLRVISLTTATAPDSPGPAIIQRLQQLASALLECS